MDIKRKAFIAKNSCWIDFLNDYNTEALEKCNEIHLGEKRGKEEKRNTLNLLKMSEELKQLQSNNIILQKDENKNMPVYRFYSEKELMIELAKWMYLNLKAFSRNETQDFIYTEKVDCFLLEALTQTIRVSFLNIKNNGGYNYGYTIYSHIPDMVKLLHLFIEYINGMNEGLKGASKLGFYKIGICPYKKLKDKKPCGKVFVGWQYNQVSCEEHCQKYQALKREHKKKSLH